MCTSSGREMDGEGSDLLNAPHSSNGPPNGRTARCEIDHSVQQLAKAPDPLTDPN